jgi:hypothetical protein
LLQKQGLITLKEGVGLLPTSLDIVNNPKKLKIVEIEAPQLTRALDDRQIALAVINTTFSSQVGLSPTRNGLFVEDKHSPYVNIFASRVDNQDSAKVKNLVQAYHSDEVAAAAAELYKGDAVKAGNLGCSRPVVGARHRPARRALLLDQIADSGPVLLNIQHRIPVVAGILRNVINRLRTIADHFENFPFFERRHRFQGSDGRIGAGFTYHIETIIGNDSFHAVSLILAIAADFWRKKRFSRQ